MIFEAAHQIGLVPIVAVLVAGRRMPAPYWLVAIGLAMSWVGDSVDHYGTGSWADLHWWPVAQFGFIVAALTHGRVRWAWLAGVGVIGAIALSRPGPDWLLAISGSLTVLLLARGALAIPLFLYFGVGTAAYLWMISTIESGILPAWYTYQSCRAVAIGAFVGLVLLHRTTVAHGLDNEDPARRGGSRVLDARSLSLAATLSRPGRDGEMEDQGGARNTPHGT